MAQEKKSRSHRPSEHISIEAAEEQGKVIEWRKRQAAMPTHEVLVNEGWKTQKALWADADYDTRCSIVYGMVIHDGAISTRDITRFFAIKPKELEPFNEVYEMARAALKLKIQRNQISIGLSHDGNPALKFNLQKQFAEQVNDPAHEGVSSVQSGPPTVVFNQTQGANEEIKAELEAAVQTAIAIAGSKSKASAS